MSASVNSPRRLCDGARRYGEVRDGAEFLGRRRPARPPRRLRRSSPRLYSARPEGGSSGEVAEWFKAHAWNACIGETLSGVRIPLSPPIYQRNQPRMEKWLTENQIDLAKAVVSMVP